MNGKPLLKLVIALFWALFLSKPELHAQLLPPDPFYELNSWSFEDTNWLSDLGYSPLSFANLNNPPSFDGSAVQVDSTNAAWLQYNIVEDDGTNNLAFGEGSIELWVLPDWNSGTGPGDWGRLIDVGAYNTNTGSSWWSLYFTPDGNNINFSSSTNGIFTNHLSATISWDTNTWHFLALTYNHTHSQLFVDGELATNGTGVFYRPSAEVLSNGFFVGSDATGWEQSRAQIDDLATYNYVLNEEAVFDDYAAGVALIGGGFHTESGGGAPPPPGGGGDSVTNAPSDVPYVPPNYTTNLWLATLGLSNNIASLMLTNTAADVLFELQGCTNLATGNWFSEGFMYGPELTNCVPANVFVSQQVNLFLRIRSWVDDTGTGIPDWWWLQYFGEITNANAYAADPAGDGYDNLQKFQMGQNPYVYYTTNAPGDFFGALDASGTNAYLEWSLASGPVLNYAIQRGIRDTNGNYSFTQIALVSSNATLFEDVGSITNANAQNNIYNLTAVYPGGNLSPTDTWNVSWYVGVYENSPADGPPDGPPMPNNVYAYETAGTNVLISWTATSSRATNYIVERVSFDYATYEYNYFPIASMGTNTTYFEDAGAVQTDEASNYFYSVEAVFPGKIVSLPAYAFEIETNPPAPVNFSAGPHPTGTNLLLSWTSPAGLTATNYLIERSTNGTSFSPVATVSGSSYEDVGTGGGPITYEITAYYADGSVSAIAYSYWTPPTIMSFNANIYITANLVRNGTGRWQIMFSGFPSNSAQTIQLTWTNAADDKITQKISITNLNNGVYPIPDTQVVSLLGYGLVAQLFSPQGAPGNVAFAGNISTDAPYFVDGRRHLKQNLSFVIEAASMVQPFGFYVDPKLNHSATNFEESSFLNSSWNSYYSYTNSPVELDNLWPFTLNYELVNYVIDTTRTNVPYGDTNFIFAPNFSAAVPAPALLNQNAALLIFQPGFQPYYYSPLAYNADNWGVTVSNSEIEASLASGLHNLYGLAYGTGCEMDSRIVFNPATGLLEPPLYHPPVYQSLPTGGSVTVLDPGFNLIGGYASECPAPTLQPTNYYFVPLLNPGANPMALPPYIQQPFPIPLNDNFNITNHTPQLIVDSVGQPMILASWAKYAISGSSPAKFAYLGQYFATNAFLLNSNGVATSNSAGILSPYGEFFPTQAGQAALATMPDIDTGQQGTNVIKIISMNVDANHDGTMDFTYAGPDQTSSSRPFRFWVNDDSDSGDDGGDGIPGKGFPEADGVNYEYYDNDVPVCRVHGTRDLVDFFPVYLNLSSLFQSNALSAGISATDTNYQFVLSQADAALRFVYTELSPTNYMNFLRDTNEAESLATNLTKLIPAAGVPLTNAILNGITTANHGVILVEAWRATTQPLVLTIYHGTNQIAQTQIYLSISGVEQMFRHKNLMLDPNAIAPPDRLTDASVPNEPDTIDKNFVFVHGYNVNTNQARGWFSDFYKRMYWSGSQAKFYGVTWEASDSQFHNLVTFNLQTNIVHAFATAPLLANFLATLTNQNVVAAHSLGNMLTLAALNDCTNINFNISQFFMIDAAVPMEAIQGNAAQDANLIYPDWDGYSNKLYASDWWQLFSTNDARNALTWNNRLANFGSTAVYNFYSSGEEVLREYNTSANGPPPTELAGSFDQVLYTLGTGLLNIGLPAGTYAWCWQEMLKGRGKYDGLVGSTHGGWSYNPAYQTNIVIMGTVIPQNMPTNIANALPDSQLETNAFFGVTSASFGSNDLALFATGGSAYAVTNRNRILSDSIPALTLPIGANPVAILGATHNFNMNTNNFENGWPMVRLQNGTELNNWHHSDCRQVAYTFTYRLFDNFVTIGGLK